ncbi:hypothetical protein Lal_00049769 [Lupinus albus]|uniref:Putative DNA (Cytosine-5-)-methyltransferase n=1 Tax=Lupinus albus TaxID=3870 RepID=A0A6A5M6Y6_LUPAL|nr:putative DNA (cytosine-5-)-methyltransferase [Lupinus albus]KAF1867340.1 hypothetical protein Lal_00049769 [Lupinus albus]
MAGSSNGREGKKAMLPKTEDDLDYDELPPYSTFSANVGDNVASSSGGKLRSFFIGMGFLPSLVDKVIEENGEDNSDMLLEVLLRSSAQKSNSDSSESLSGSLNTRGKRSAPTFFPVDHSNEPLRKSNSESSDSLDSLFDDKDPPEISTVNQPKEEPDELNDDKRRSLLMMNFSAVEVEFAINKLGCEASVSELVDFIFVAQIAEKFKKETDDNDITRDDIFAAKIAQKFKTETDDVVCLGVGEVSNEKLFGIMAKTLQLLDMGFSENEVSSAFDRLGPEVPVSEYANFIFAQQNGIEYVMEYKFPRTFAYSMGVKVEPETDLYGTAEVKVESFSHEPSHSRQVNLGATYSGNGVKKEDSMDEFPNAASNLRFSDFVENDRGKRPKYEYDDDSSFFLDPYWVEEKFDTDVAGMSELYKPNKPRRLNTVAAKPPFFLYGNISNIPSDSWAKLSQFLYGIEPEFVNTQFFSALTRREGYLHNLPTENRSHILPPSPMTIEDTIPQTKKWWPPWDSRKHLSCINSETNGLSQHCDRLGRMIADSGGVPSSEQQRDILRYCRGLNLMWTGKYKLSPIEPEQLEVILGYPLNHTHGVDNNVTERLKSLKYCFQTDTLGYHLSVLKPMFPDGLTVVSLFSGIGGAGIALHRLGIKIKVLVSVETSETKRKIVERWWRSSGQKGNLVQLEDIQKLTTKTLGNIVSKYGVIDLVISQHPTSSSSLTVHPGQSLSAVDFSLFCEAVRVLQRVRGVCY